VPEFLDLRIGPPAHGGHCVARHEGRVIFVRHTAPGELVRVQITATTARYQRGDAVHVLQAAPDRVPTRWPEAGPGGVGGGELAHLRLPAQREWKRQVLLDTLARIGHLDAEHPALAGVQVQALPGDQENDGLHYRSRISLHADEDGRAGMYGHRSHRIHPLAQMPLADQRILAAGVLTTRWPARSRIEAVAPSAGEVSFFVNGEPWRQQRRRVREQVLLDDGQVLDYRLAGTGFWQVHTRAPQVLVQAVLAAARIEAGSQVLDLYSGAGLFTTPLARATGQTGRVHAVEGDAQAASDARRNAHGQKQISLHSGGVQQVLGAAGPTGSVVVLDPPRAGAGPEVMAQILTAGGRAQRAPERVVYVACDPAALARDVASAAEHGYELVSLRALDLFPHTHHMECVAVLSPR